MEYEMDFGEILKHVKAGLQVARKGWNGKGMYLELIPADGWAKLFGNTADYVPPFIVMKTADDKLVPWLASQTDILAEDWVVIG